MKSIKNNTSNEYIIKKSKFITYLFKINNEEDVFIVLNDIKKKEKDATHYCYAYIINNIKRLNDDGEPSGTAGSPILKTLEQCFLNDVLCIVVRYFGGIKLGANGLIRAYSKVVKDCIDNSIIIEQIKGKKITIDFTYINTKVVDYLLQKYDVINKSYNDYIRYVILIANDDYAKIKNELDRYIISIKIEDWIIEK